MKTIVTDVVQLENILYVLLTQFGIEFETLDMGSNKVYTINKFGVKIAYVAGQEFDASIMKNWREVYIYPDFTLEATRNKIVWALVRGGYFHYLRHNFRNTFKMMLSSQGWDKMLIEYRDNLYNKSPKYNYLRELNLEGLENASSYILSIDPGFYDWIITC